MARIFMLFVASIFLAVNLVASNAIGQEQEKEKLVEETYILAYYFHGNFRCSNCFKIEQYSKEAIEAYFKNEIDSGKIVFKPINIEEKGNEHFAVDYQLYTKSLVISLVKDGKEVKYKNLAKVWEYLDNKQGFYEYVKDEVNEFLKELK